MIDKRVIAVIVIFILGGLFIYSFANPLDDTEEKLENGGSYNGSVVTPSENEENQEPVTIDTKALDNIKEQLAALNQEDYTEESWTLIQNLIHGAEESTSQEEFDLLFSQIDLGTLTTKPVETVVVANPSTSNVSSNTKPNTNVVNNTKPSGNSGTSTTNNVSPQIDKTALNNIKAQLAALNQSDYTTSSWNVVQAQVKVADLQTTQAGFNTAVSQINLGLLEKKAEEVNKADLNNAKSQVAGLNPSAFTAESYQKVVEASNLPENTQAEVDAKKKAIDAAIKGLQTKPAEINQTALNNIKNQLASLNPNDYTSASWNAIQNQIAVAEKQTTQEKFNEEVEKINLNTLQKKPIDQTALNNIKNELAKLTQSNYTVASWQAIQNQITVVEKQVTQAKFDAEVAKIDLNTLQIRSTTPQIGVSLDKLGDSANIRVVKVNDTYYRYTGEMHTNTLTVGNQTINNFIVMKIASPEALSETEKANIQLVFDGVAYDASEFMTDVNNHSYIEIYQPFSPSNAGWGDTSDDYNLRTIDFTIYWGYGETKQYKITIDIAVN